jgi:hypothetical protein
MAQKRPGVYRGDRRRKEDQRKAKQDAKRARKAERRESGTSGPEIEAPASNGAGPREFVWFTTATVPSIDGVDDWTLVGDPRLNPGA